MSPAVVVQLTVNAAVVASQYALMAAGFILIYRVARVFHFAHGITFILGAYGVFLLSKLGLRSFLLSALLAVAACGVFGAAIELFVYRHLRKRGSGTTAFLIASLGIYITAQNALSLSFGDDTQGIGLSGFRQSLVVWGIRATAGQLAGVTLAFLGLGLLAYLLRATGLGRRWRACAADLLLARVVGIDVDRALLLCFFVGSCLAGLSGICVCLDIDMNPTRGMQALIMAFVVYVVAGRVSLVAVTGASCLVAFSQTFGGWYVGTEWQGAIAFVILLLFLIWRHGRARRWLLTGEGT